MSFYELLEEIGIDCKTKRSGQIKTQCHWCCDGRTNKKDLCLSVNIDEGTYYCHHCENSGKVSRSTEKVDNVLPVPKLQKVSDSVIKFFENKRKISNITLLRFGVSEAMENMPPDFTPKKCICFNYFRNGKKVNTKFRTGGKQFKMIKGAEMILYNINALEKETEAVIVEGEIDCMTMHECGIYNSVSVPNGSGSKMDCIDSCSSYFTNKVKIILAVDNDAPGMKLREALADKLGKHRCYKVEYPEGCKDANEVLVKHGKEAVRQLIVNAEPYTIGIIAPPAPGKDQQITFPLSVLPDPIVQYIKAQPQIQEDFLAAAILSGLATAIGNTAFLRAMDGYVIKAILYMALVGAPGSSKSPAMKRAFELLEKYDSKQYREFQEKLVVYNEESELAETTKKEKPVKPQFNQILIKDSTIEMLVKILSFNPHGCGLYADELAGLLNRFNQYKSGDELEKWLELWSGTYLLIQRMSRDENKIENPFCGIIGGIQPGVLEKLSKDEKEHNGFYHRFLFVYPDPQPKSNWQQIIIPEDVKDGYAEVFQVLLEWRQIAEPTAYSMTFDANLRYTEWYNEQNVKYNKAISDQMKGVFAKYQDYCLRFALIIQVVMDGRNRPAAGKIHKEAMEKAITLTEYFLVNMKKAIKILAPDSPADGLQEPYLKFYDSLPEVFTSKLAIGIGEELNIPVNTVKSFLKRQVGKLFENPERGNYFKLF